MSTTITLYPSSTFIASGQPTNNFSLSPYIYVGTVGALGSTIGLLSIPALPTPPAGTTLQSAYLQLGVFTTSGLNPTTVIVNRLLSPSPLNTSTVTWNTPGIVYTPSGVTKSISTAMIGTNVQIDLTALVASWYAGTPDPGLALTDTDGSLVLFDSSSIGTPTVRPQLILTFDGGGGIATNVNIVGHGVASGSETVTTANASISSAARDVSQKTKVSFYVKNTGTNLANVGIETSADGVSYFQQLPATTVPGGATIVLTPNNYATYARLFYQSTVLGLPTTLTFNYIAQA